MRRQHCAIEKQEEMEAILGDCTIGRMATTGRDGYPYITPVNYVYRQGGIYFHCSHEGEKMENLLADNRVCFEVDIPLAYLGVGSNAARSSCQLHQLYQCIIVRGRAEIVDDLQEKVAALNALVAAHEPTGDFAEITAETPAVQSCSVVAVRIERMSGKRDLVQNKSAAAKQHICDYLSTRNLPGDKKACGLIVD